MGVSFTLEPLHAWLVCVVWAVVYVGVLYLVPPRIRALPRGHDKHIMARFGCVGGATACVLGSLWVMAKEDPSSPPLLVWLGVRLPGLLPALVLPLLLTKLLFMGPLLALFLMAGVETGQEVDAVGVGSPRSDQGRPSASLAGALVREVVGKSGYRRHRLGFFRNLVVGPLSEEVVFRACVVPLLLSAGVGAKTVVLLSPFVFGIAHLHHLRETLRQGAPLPAAVLMTLFQTLYTSLFGAYAAFLFVRTGHLLPALLSHVFCNFMGLPDVSFNTPPGGQASYRLSVLYPLRGVLWGAYGVGVALFVGLLLPLTRPALYSTAQVPWDKVMPWA